MRIKKILLLFIISVVIASNFSIALADIDPSWVTDNLELRDNAVGSADSAILVDANSGKILFTKGAYNSMNPASTTKIMTALLVVENVDEAQMNDIVTVTNEMTVVIEQLDPVSTIWADKGAFLQNGEQVTVDSLLHGLMMNSGNDAAVVLAFYVGGTYENFLAMMNAKASELGMTTTSYTSPHGLTDEGHKTSARDMALLAMYAKQYPAFEELVSTVTYQPADTNKRSFSGGTWKNSNKLINGDPTYGYEYATGIKTGYTQAAESCLVSSALNGDQSLIAVVLHDTQSGKWTNSKTLFEYGYQYYETIDVSTLFSQNQITAEVDKANPSTSDGELTMSLGEVEAVYLTDFEDVIAKIIANPSEYFVEEITYANDALIAPIQQGETVGLITYTYTFSYNSDDFLGYKAAEGDVQEVIFTAPLIANETIEAQPIATSEPTSTPAPTNEPGSGGLGNFDVGTFALYGIIILFVVLVILLILLMSARKSPNNRYSSSSSSNSARHFHDDRGGSTKRRRH